MAAGTPSLALIAWFSNNPDKARMMLEHAAENNDGMLYWYATVGHRGVHERVLAYMPKPLDEDWHNCGERGAKTSAVADKYNRTLQAALIVIVQSQSESF